MLHTVSVGQTVFARWRDGYYYPAIVAEVLSGHIKANYLDGDVGIVPNEHVMSLQEGFETLNFQGNWRYLGFFYKGVITSHEPMIMNYNDGDVEQVELRQLRGKMPKAQKQTTGFFSSLFSSAPPAPPVRNAEDRLEQLESMYKTGLISKEEYEQRKRLLR